MSKTGHATPPGRAVSAVRSAVTAFNAGDLDGYLAHVHPDGIRWLAGLGLPLPRADVEAGLRELAGAFSGLRLDEEALFGDDHSACARWRLRGTHSGAYGGQPPTGRLLDVPTCEVYRVDEAGLVIESWVYGDVLAIFEQIATVPA